uniref:Uncharacterized protein n=1 Tax=viral metagenome TaxID=1070528 RepID=A0A6C0M0Z5_9ZZZZ
MTTKYTLKDLISTLNLKDLKLTLKDLKCSNTAGIPGGIPGTWISVKVVGKTDVLDKSIARVIGNRVIKNSFNKVLKFYYVDETNETNKRKYITFNENCQMIYDNGTSVPESVIEKPVFIEETEISDEEFQELMEQSPLPVKTKSEETKLTDKEQSGKTEGGKKRRSSHKKRRSSHKKRRSSHKKRRSSHKKRRH